jgi:DNA-binding SARP family transcriptional activator
MLELRVLGSLDLRDGAGVEVRAVLVQPKRLALLAYLAVHAGGGGFHRRDTLLGLFWPESDSERARGALRRALYVLRQALGEGVLVSRGDDEVGLASGTFWCDAAEFARRLEGGAPADALALYRGDLLSGVFVPDAPEFEAWLAGERQRLRDRATAAAWAVATAAEEAGHGAEAARVAIRAVELAEGAEPAVRRQMELSVRLGDPAGALQTYDALVARLAREYDVAPAPETRALAAAIRAAPGAGVPRRASLRQPATGRRRPEVPSSGSRPAGTGPARSVPPDPVQPILSRPDPTLADAARAAEGAAWTPPLAPAPASGHRKDGRVGRIEGTGDGSRARPAWWWRSRARSCSSCGRRAPPTPRRRSSRSFPSRTMAPGARPTSATASCAC